MTDLREKIAQAIGASFGEASDYVSADAVLFVLRQQEPVAWVHPTNLVNPALGIMCSPIQLGSGQVPLYAAPMPASVPEHPTTAMLDAAEKLDWANEDVRAMCCNLWYVMNAAAPKPEDGK